ncbi:hypothetical protein Tsubulata_020479 [Turnera subulata]|uniref:Zinc knuckle CX2CX4HX4C domain-containing protein n=1 Tax=Turnera subulata TaxID=218843 RepID=A0A9Q0F463_9ROSI|nr:hypothetical protein Tsubulata_020479 [Turnera subulata]
MSSPLDFQWKEEDFVVKLKALGQEKEMEDIDHAFGDIISKTHLEGGQKLWVKIKYERLGELCYRCGHVTHNICRCTRPPREDEGLELEYVLSVEPWMGAREIVESITLTKNRVPRRTPSGTRRNRPKWSRMYSSLSVELWMRAREVVGKYYPDKK